MIENSVAEPGPHENNAVLQENNAVPQYDMIWQSRFCPRNNGVV
jgi:hypothetical protein